MSPAVSPEQKQAACMALAIKRGDLKPKAGTPSASMALSMSEAELVKMCGHVAKK